MDVSDYRTIFENVEATLIRVGEQNGDAEAIREGFAFAKAVATKTFTDAEYFRTLIHIPFYSGFRAVTVGEKLLAIDKHFCDYETVAAYGEAHVRRMMADSGMIRHERKIRGCVDNARQFKAIVMKHGSFKKYLDGFAAQASLPNLLRLRKDLMRRFSYLGSITSLHFLTDIGMPVLKPDEVIRRIFSRLGLVADASEREERLWEVVQEGQRFAEATKYPIRYVDIVFVAYGQVRAAQGKHDMPQGICVEEHPRCAICGVTKYCRYVQKNRPA